jgi:hypothetical protein
MGLSNGFLCWFVWMIIGAIISILEYIIGKIILSQKILTVLYLQSIDNKLSNNQDKQDEKLPNNQDKQDEKLSNNQNEQNENIAQ